MIIKLIYFMTVRPNNLFYRFYHVHVVVVVKKTNTEYRSQKSALHQKELPTINNSYPIKGHSP